MMTFPDANTRDKGDGKKHEEITKPKRNNSNRTLINSEKSENFHIKSHTRIEKMWELNFHSLFLWWMQPMDWIIHIVIVFFVFLNSYRIRSWAAVLFASHIATAWRHTEQWETDR